MPQGAKTDKPTRTKSKARKPKPMDGLRISVLTASILSRTLGGRPGGGIARNRDASTEDAMDPASQWHLLNDPRYKEPEVIKKNPVKPSCNEDLAKAKKPMPRTCMSCGLGPCNKVVEEKPAPKVKKKKPVSPSKKKKPSLRPKKK